MSIPPCRFVLRAFVLFISASAAHGHPAHTDPLLSELNDYLMALQVIRHTNSEADVLFRRWEDVQESSRKIRKLTDEQDLAITAPRVAEQIAEARSKRDALLGDWRAFFQRQAGQMPTIKVHLAATELHLDPVETAVLAPVGSRRVVLIAVTSDRAEPVNLRLSAPLHDQILFWNTDLMVSSSRPAYSFVYAAPLESGASQTSLTIDWDRRHRRTLAVRVTGTLPATDEWYNRVPVSTAPGGTATTSAAPPAKQPDGAWPTNVQPIRFRIRDPDTGEPMPVRVEVTDAKGAFHWTPLRGSAHPVSQPPGHQTPLLSFQGGPFFYIGGDAELGVDAKGKTVRVHRGFEHEPVAMRVPDNGLVEAAPRRWINMPALGWYSGHTHIHTTDIGIPVQYSRFWWLVTRAEDMGVSSILTFHGKHGDFAVNAAEYPMGSRAAFSTATHHVLYGEEYRNNPYGHVALLGLKSMITPVSSGVLGELAGPDYPPNDFVLDEAVSQGALTIGAHFGLFIMDGRPIKAAWPSTGFEFPINVALGKLHLAEIYGTNREDVWYKFLNCGFDLPATAGPDWRIKDAPRAYAYLGSNPFTVEEWLTQLRQGRSFITKGPMLFFTVDGALPGAKLHFPDRHGTVLVKASALTRAGSKPVEILVNGTVVASGSDLAEKIALEDSCWIAARCEGAHSNPVYVTLQGRPRGMAAPAREFLAVIGRLEEWVKTKGHFENAAQRETVLNLYAEARAVYDAIIARASRHGRE